jgi:hypothetical protein
MTKPNWKDIAEFVGITAIVASLIFVSVQLGQDREVALSVIRQSGASSNTELQIAIASHAEILAKSNRGDELTEAEMIVMNALVSAMHREVVTDQLERRTFGSSGEIVTVIFATWLYENPGARAIWMKQREEFLLSVEQILPDEGVARQYTDEVRRMLEIIEEPRL